MQILFVFTPKSLKAAISLGRRITFGAPQDSRNIQIDVLTHSTHRAWVRRNFDDWLNRVADDVALARWKDMNSGDAGRLQGHALRGSR